MSILFRRNKVTKFVTVDFGKKSCDWPKNMPMPHIGEFISIDELRGRVIDIRYSILQNLYDIRIVVEKD